MSIPGAIRIICLLLLPSPLLPADSFDDAFHRSGSSPQLAVYFSPRGGCESAVVGELGAARKTVRVQAYSFTNAAIAQALVGAHRRGVDVKVVLDRGGNATTNYSAADFVAHAGIPTWLDGAHAIAHNKVMIIDGETLITGSFNFTAAAEKSNAENLLVIKNARALVAKYEANWLEHQRHSESYAGKSN
jgi:phosphatidylserine/phosphatidylglycerophosphate/cardiolipin synthase-like enzyme